MILIALALAIFWLLVAHLLFLPLPWAAVIGVFAFCVCWLALALCRVAGKDWE